LEIEDYSAIQKPNIMRRDPLTFDYKSYEGNEYDKIKKKWELLGLEMLVVVKHIKLLMKSYQLR
jgi:hypothetical protein